VKQPMIGGEQWLHAYRTTPFQATPRSGAPDRSRYTACATRSRSAMVRIPYAPRDAIELAGTEGDFEALWAEVGGARTTDDRVRQRFGPVPRGNADSSPPRGPLLQSRSARGCQRSRVLSQKSNR
jgi:hypothetical protein